MQKFDRYRLYYILMNVSLAAIISGIGSELLYNIGIEHHLDGPIGALAFFLVGLFSVLLPIFLIVARFMRDQYAEEIWKKTAKHFMYVIALIPLFIQIQGWILFGWIKRLDNSTYQYFYHHPIFLPIQWILSTDSFELFMRVWVYSICFFVILFQWHRWRDSR